MKLKQKKTFIILISALATVGCVPVAKKFAVEFKDPSAFKNLKLDVSSVQVQNNQLIVHGSGLKDIKTIKLVNNGVTETLVVESATSGQLVANGLSAVAIGVGKIFDMVLADAYGSATVPVTFTLENGSITAAHLSDMGAVSGQVLKYNGTDWEPSTLSSSQVYQGVWNANTNIPNLNLTSPVSGEYYIVSVAGTYNTVAFDVGDWIIHNGTSWDKVVSSAANKLSLSGGTLTGDLQLDTLLKFKGASNYVTLKASPTLATDIILTLPKTVGTTGQFLTTDGTGVMSWTTPVDPVIDNLDATQIADGSVTSAAFQYLSGATSNIQAQLNAKQATGNFVTALTGDVTASGAGSVAATVATVGGATAANIAAGVALANAATNANTASSIIKRDASGNFSAGTITGTFNGNATNVTGTVAVANGGTGNTTLGVNQLLFGNGTSAVSGLAITAIPSVLLSTIASGAPAWTTSTTGNVLKGSVSGVGFGALDSSDLPAGTLSGAGTANYVPYYNTTSTLANSPIAVSGNNVGIGTATPGAIFEISSTAPSMRISNPNVTISDFSTTGFSPALGANTTAQWVNYSNSTGGYQLAGFTKSGTNNGVPAALVGYHGGTAPTTAAILLSGWKWNGATTRAALASSEIVTQVANATTPLMTVMGSGNVGIGTIMPGSILEAWSSATATGITSVSSAALGIGSGGGVALRTSVYPTAADQRLGGFFFGATDGAATPTTLSGAGIFGWSAQAFSAANAGSYLTFETAPVGSSNRTQRMRINSDGSIGIGTSTTNDKLDVYGAIRSSRNASQYIYLSGGDATNQHNYLRGMSTEGNKKIMYFQSFNDASGSPAGTNGFQFQTGTIATPLNAMSILESGKVGIGTTAPFSPLNIVFGNGTIPNDVKTRGVLSEYYGIGNHAGKGGVAMIAGGTKAAPTAVAVNNTSSMAMPLFFDGTVWRVGSRIDSYVSAVTDNTSVASGLTFNVGTATGDSTLGLFTGMTEAMRILPSGNIGIGTTAPNSKLVVTDGSTPQASVAAVTPLLSVQTSGPAYIMGKDLTNGIEYMFGTSTLGVAWTGSTSNHNFQLRTNNLPRVSIDTAGYVGIGTLTPSTLLHVKTTTAGATVATFESGTGSCTVVPNSGMSCSSDMRLKENVEKIINGLDKVLNLRGVTFQWKERSAADDSRHMGFIAQEVEKVAPELVSSDARGYKRVNYANFVAVLTEAVKDLYHKWSSDGQILRREMASVKAESAQLKEDNELLKLENKAIKSYLCSRDPKAVICK